MGSAVSSGSNAPSNAAPQDGASTSNGEPIDTAVAPPVQEASAPLVVAEGRYHPYPGQEDMNISWTTPSRSGRPTFEAPGDGLMLDLMTTPQAAFALAPVQTEPIPYTPPHGFPPVVTSMTSAYKR